MRRGSRPRNREPQSNNHYEGRSMSNGTSPLSSAQLAEFFSAHSGAAIAGVTPRTIRLYVKPDAIVYGHQGKRYGLYTRQTLEAYAARRQAQVGAE